MKKIKVLLSFILSIMLLSGSIRPVYANSYDRETNELKPIVFTNLGVDVKTANTLISKIEKGEVIDSLNSKYNNTKPVYTQVKDDGTYIERYEYPDGSVKLLKIIPDIFKGEIKTGDYTSGSYWYNHKKAKVIASWGVVTASYYADFSGSTQSGTISRVYDYGISVVGGTFSNASLYINRKNASDNPAQATLKFEGKAIKSFGHSTFYLRLFVPKGSSPYCEFSILN